MEMEHKSPEVPESPNTAKKDPLTPRSRRTCKHLLKPLELRFLCACVTLLASITVIAAVSSDNWLSDGRFSMGLWVNCEEPECPLDPDVVVTVTEYTAATRGMMVSSTVCATFSVVLISTSFFQHRIQSFSLACCCSVTNFISSLLVMIAMTIYTHELVLDKTLLPLETEWSFDAAWGSFPLFFLAGILTGLLAHIES